MFTLKSDYRPTGDQPQAINKLISGIKKGEKHQVLLGVTGSGKTFTAANVIAAVQKPTLVMAHNKTLAAQLYQEFKEFFPDNAVCYFVSYYDYYQPESYLPRTDTYLEKETEINEEIDKLRLAATTALLTRPDVIIVASVSCIYNLGNPAEYGEAVLVLQARKGSPCEASRQVIMKRLLELQYERSDFDFRRGSFRVRGENIDIYPAYTDYGIRIRINDKQIQQICKIEPVSGKITEELEKFVVYPAKHYLPNPQKYKAVFAQIRKDLDSRVKELLDCGKELEAHRLRSRVNYDLEMITEIGYVNGIENYSRYFDGRKPGEPPYTLLDYFGKDYLLIIDESHMTVPQIRGMYRGDQSRKQTLIDFGFRLPAAMDNRPLQFEEFLARTNQIIYTSATPDEWEINQAGGGIVEQLVRPTGLIDPEVIVKPTKGQIGDLIERIKERVEKKERVLVTTLTKRMAEELTEYLNNELRIMNYGHKIRIAYLHSDVETLERTKILRQLRLGEYDVLVGINLLREGLDLPEVSLVAILDADKEGFLRSRTSLIQTMGRAARHIRGQVILYADTVTRSMQEAVNEINRRRIYQIKWNEERGVTPRGIEKPVREELTKENTNKSNMSNKTNMTYVENWKDLDFAQLMPEEKEKLKKVLTRRMHEAAKILDFEGAARYRDKIKELRSQGEALRG